MNKIIFCVIIGLLMMITGCSSPHKQIRVEQVDKVILFSPIGDPGEDYESSEMSANEFPKLINWYNEAYDIRKNNSFKGAASILGVKIVLKDKTELSVIDSGEDFEIQIDYVSSERTVSFWARQQELDDFLKTLAGN